jgi:hypothetical protein
MTLAPEAPTQTPMQARSQRVLEPVTMHLALRASTAYGSAEDELYRAANTTREALTAARAFARSQVGQARIDADATASGYERRLNGIEAARIALRDGRRD